jgi:cytochrome c553
MLRLFCIATFTLFISLNINAEDWVVPELKKKQNANFKFSDKSKKMGKELYIRNCASCHGNPTKSDYAQLLPEPGDLSKDKVKNQTDGALFFKLTKGRGLMPSFSTSLSAEQRWQIISYIRMFHEGYVQIVELKSDKANQERVLLKLKKLSGEEFLATAQKIVKGKAVEASNIEVALYVKRYFGDLQVDETKYTNKKGEVIFKVQETIPADLEGKLMLKVRALNYENSMAQQEFTYGVKNTKLPLNAQRALWNTTSKAPIWLVILFVTALLFIGAVILYVLNMLRKLKNEN